MVYDKFYLFRNSFLFCLLIQKLMQISAGESCLNPTFKKDEKLIVDYFFNAEVSSHRLSPVLCPIILASNGQFSIVYHMSSSPIDKATCMQNFLCVKNRKFSCYYKYYKDEYNKCTQSLPSMDATIGDCVCDGAADDILTANEALRVKYGIKKLPALVLNGKYDPCFTDYSSDGIKDYFCKAYKKELPLCKRGN